MSRGAPPTQLLSAVSPQVSQQVAAGGQMNLQQQQVSNQAMARRNQEQIQRQQLDQQRVLSEEALRQRSVESLLQAENYNKLNASNLQIARERNQQAALGRAQEAQMAQEDRDLRREVMQNEMRMHKQSQALELGIALAENQTASPEAIERLTDLRAQMVENSIRRSEAELAQAGLNREAGQYRDKATKAIREYQDQIDTILERGTGDLAQFMTGDLNPLEYFETESMLPGPIEAVRSIGVFGDTFSNFSRDAFNLFLPAGSELTSVDVERALMGVRDNPDFVRGARLNFSTDMVKRAIEGVFPDADASRIAASYLGVINSLETTPADRREEMVNIFMEDAREAGVDPLAFGELIRRIGSAKAEMRDTYRERGITAGQMVDGLTEATAVPFLSSQLADELPGERILTALTPSLAPTRAWLGTLESEGDLRPEQVRTLLEQVQEEGFADQFGEVQELFDLVEQSEEGAEGLAELAREAGIMEMNLDEATTDAEMDRARRSRLALEALIGDLGGIR